PKKHRSSLLKLASSTNSPFDSRIAIGQSSLCEGCLSPLKLKKLVPPAMPYSAIWRRTAISQGMWSENTRTNQHAGKWIEFIGTLRAADALCADRRRRPTAAARQPCPDLRLRRAGQRDRQHVGASRGREAANCRSRFSRA